MILSILIPTIEERKEQYEKLHRNLSLNIEKYGLKGEVEIVSICDNKEMPIGEKRNRLYKLATGSHSLQLDDDDLLSDDAIKLITDAIKFEDADCVTFKELCIINGRTFECKHSLMYDDWGERKDGFRYVRTPFCKDAIRTSICKQIPVPEIRFGEDHAWARLIKPHLKTETHINEFLYIYKHDSTDFKTRYGIK